MKEKFSQKRKGSTSRKQIGKVNMPSTARGLTSQAGLLPVVKYLCRIGFEKIVKQDVPRKRGDNANYRLSDVVMLTLVGMIGGAISIAKICVVWSDDVLREVAGWIQLPAETTISRLFKEVTERQINQLESVNHRLRGQVWRRVNRSGASAIGLNPTQWVDIDSTVDSVCGTPAGAAKGYNPKNKGSRSYHPQLAFLAGSKEIRFCRIKRKNAYFG